MKNMRNNVGIILLLCVSLMSFLLGCSTKEEQKDENHLQQGRELLSTALKTSLETIHNSDGYRYVWTRSFYEEGNKEDTAKLENSFLKEGNATILEQKQVYEGQEYVSVYADGKGYGKDGETSGILCKTPEEINSEVDGWSATYLFDKDLTEETVTEFEQTGEQYEIKTNAEYDGGSTQWLYQIDVIHQQITQMTGKDFDEDGNLYAEMKVEFDYHTPQIELSLIEEMNASDLRTATIVTNPGTATESTEQYTVGEGFAFYVFPDEGYAFFEDRDGKIPAELASTYGYGDVTLYQIPVEEQEEDTK